MGISGTSAKTIGLWACAATVSSREGLPSAISSKKSFFILTKANGTFAV